MLHLLFEYSLLENCRRVMRGVRVARGCVDLNGLQKVLGVDEQTVEFVRFAKVSKSDCRMEFG